MKTKAFSSLLILTMLVLSVGMVSACTGYDCPVEYTTVNGTIYQGEIGGPVVPGATVEVTCHHGTSDYTKPAVTSDSNGKYSVTYYSDARCDYGDEVTVVAYKNGVGTGTENGEVNQTHTTYHGYFWCSTLNVGIVNVPLVPEFGLVVGAVTLFSAVGIFFFVRRK
jgi:hypothetical protein